MEVIVEKIIDRHKIAESIVSILDSGMKMLKKEKIDQADYGKIKVIRSITSAVSAGVLMIQQETAQERNLLISERMKQMGYALNGGEKAQIT